MPRCRLKQKLKGVDHQQQTHPNTLDYYNESLFKQQAGGHVLSSNYPQQTYPNTWDYYNESLFQKQAGVHVLPSNYPQQSNTTWSNYNTLPSNYQQQDSVAMHIPTYDNYLHQQVDDCEQKRQESKNIWFAIASIAAEFRHLEAADILMKQANQKYRDTTSDDPQHIQALGLSIVTAANKYQAVLFTYEQKIEHMYKIKASLEADYKQKKKDWSRTRCR